VFIRASHHVPPPPEAVNDAMSALLETLEREPEVIVRAVMGHWLFGFIHPYMDGNGRMARFPMNFMMASGGCPWIMRRGVSEQVGGPKGAGGRIAVLLMSPDGKENRASGLGFRSMTGSSRTPMDWRISLILERTLCVPLVENVPQPIQVLSSRKPSRSPMQPGHWVQSDGGTP
jgi:hypothetical protein